MCEQIRNFHKEGKPIQTGWSFLHWTKVVMERNLCNWNSGWCPCHICQPMYSSERLWLRPPTANFARKFAEFEGSLRRSWSCFLPLWPMGHHVKGTSRIVPWIPIRRSGSRNCLQRGIRLTWICRVDKNWANCMQILQGLKFIHNELGICHGDLTCSSVLVDDGGTVKIGGYPLDIHFPLVKCWRNISAGIGESMIREPILQGKSQDIEALCNIARSLLGLEPGRVRGTMGRLAKNFTNAPPNATVDDLLQVSSHKKPH